jgi:hypothetical protein
MEGRYVLAGIDVHKKMLAVVVANCGSRKRNRPSLQYLSDVVR